MTTRSEEASTTSWIRCYRGSSRSTGGGSDSPIGPTSLQSGSSVERSIFSIRRSMTTVVVPTTSSIRGLEYLEMQRCRLGGSFRSCEGSDLLIRGPGGLRGVRAICLQKRGLRDPCLNGLDSVVGNGNDTFLDWQNHLALTRRKVPFPKHYYR